MVTFEDLKTKWENIYDNLYLGFYPAPVGRRPGVEERIYDSLSRLRHSDDTQNRISILNKNANFSDDPIVKYLGYITFLPSALDSTEYIDLFDRLRDRKMTREEYESVRILVDALQTETSSQ